MLQRLKRWVQILRISWGTRHVPLDQLKPRYDAYLASLRPIPPSPPLVGYFTPASGIAGLHKRRDAVAQLREIGLDKLEMLASRSLGPVDPRLLGRRSDGTAVFEIRNFHLQQAVRRDQAVLLDLYRAVRG